MAHPDTKGQEARQASARGIEALSAWAAGLRWEDIPQAARHAMARILADDMASMLAARDEPELAAAHAALLRNSRAPEATGSVTPAVSRFTRTARTPSACISSICAAVTSLPSTTTPRARPPIARIASRVQRLSVP